MTNSAIVDRERNEVFEGLLDAICTTAIAIYDLRREGGNSDFGSVYVVEPKLHGPEEAAFSDEVFKLVEEIFGASAIHGKARHHG